MSTLAKTTSDETTKNIFNLVKKEAENAFILYFFGNLIVGFVFAQTTNLLGPYILISFLSALSFVGARLFFPHTALTSHLASLSLAIYSIFYLYSTDGWFGSHFFIFVSCVVLIKFQDWKVFVSSYVLTLLYTFTSGYFQIQETDILYLDKGQEIDFQTVLFYQIVLAFYYFFCGFLANSLNKKTENEHINSLALKNKLSELEQSIKLAKQISVGNTEFERKDIKDDLGIALMEMAKNIDDAKAKESHDNYINTGLASTNDILRKNMENFDTLAEKTIFNLARHMDAVQGGLYLVEEDHNEKFLSLQSSCAYNRKKFLEKRVPIDEGLLGQVLQEEQTLLIDSLPEDYSLLKSGLGETSPKYLLIVPLRSNERTIGVIELASLKPFEKRSLEFIEKASESIATTILFTKSNSETAKLLINAEQMANELQAQEEEMRQNLEELQATQEEMKRTQNEIKLKESNLRAFIDNTEDTIFALDKNYRITVVNATLKERYRASGMELKEGLNIFDVIPDNQVEYWKTRYDKAFNGEKFVENLQRPNGDSITYLESYISPIFDNQNNVIGASVTSHDISDRMLAQADLKEKELQLNGILENTDQYSIMVLDKEYKPLMFNHVTRKFYPDLTSTFDNNGDIRAFLDEHDKSNFFRRDMERAFNNKKRTKVEEIDQKGKIYYYFLEIFPLITDEENEVEQICIVSRDISDVIASDKNQINQINALKTVLRSNTDKVMYIDEAFNVKVVSNSMTNLLNSMEESLHERHNIKQHVEQSQNHKLLTAIERVSKGNRFSVPFKQIFENSQENNQSKIDFSPVVIEDANCGFTIQIIE